LRDYPKEISTKSTLSAAAAVLTLAFGAAHAAEPASAAAPSAADAATNANATVSDAEVRKIADIVIEAHQVNAAAEAKIQAAADAQAKAKAESELGAARAATVHKHGLSLERYNAIAGAVQTDEALKARIVAAATTPAS